MGSAAAVEDVSRNSKELAEGTIFSFAGNALFKLVSFIYIVVIAKVVAQDDLGLFYLAMGFISLTAIADDLGLASSLARYVPFFEGKGQGGKIRRLVHLSYVLVIAMALLLMAVLWLSSDFIGQAYQDPHLADAIKTLSVLPLLGNLFRVSNNLLQGRRDMASMQLYQNLQNLFKLAITLVLIQYLDSSFQAVAYGVILSYLAVLPFTFLQVSRSLSGLGGGGSGLQLSQVATEILPFGLTMNLLQSLGVFVAGANLILLGYFTDPLASAATVAVYSVVTMLSYALMVFPSSIASIFLPMMSHLHGKGDRQQMFAVAETAQRWALLISLPVGICLAILSSDIISAVYGESFLSGSNAMSIVSIGLLIGAFTAMLPAALSAMRLVGVQLLILVLTGVVNIILALALIPSFGMAGAAGAAAVSSISSSLLYYYVARKYLDFWRPKVAYRLAAAALISIVVIILLKPLVPVVLPFGPSGIFIADQLLALAYLVAKMSVVVAVFLALTVLLRCFKNEDVGIIGKVMRKARIPEPAISLSMKALSLGISG